MLPEWLAQFLAERSADCGRLRWCGGTLQARWGSWTSPPKENTFQHRHEELWSAGHHFHTCIRLGQKPMRNIILGQSDLSQRARYWSGENGNEDLGIGDYQWDWSILLIISILNSFNFNTRHLNQDIQAEFQICVTISMWICECQM